MNATDKNLAKLVAERAFVSIYRKGIDLHALGGFVIDYSDTLLLVAAVSDFVPNGRVLLRRDDVTKITHTATGKFQKSLLETEGILASIDFENPLPLSTLGDFLRSLDADEIVVLEDEQTHQPEFFIGRIKRVKKKSVQGLYFYGDGEWDDRLSKFRLSSITRCEVGTIYTGAYARHFARIEGSAAGLPSARS